MPNHITNYLTVSGSPEEVERFRITVSTENPDLKALYMKDLENKKKEYEDHLSGKKKTYYRDDYVEERLKTVTHQIDTGEIDECVLSFEGTIPMPTELDGTVSGSDSAKPEWQKKRSKEFIVKYGADNWYDFNVRNWGTKWNAYDIGDIQHNDDGSLTYRFDTAWSPPGIWLEKTAEMFPSLTFEDAWKDEGGGAGLITLCVNEGIVVCDEIEEREWLLKNDPDAKDEYDFITSGDYDEVIKKYSQEECGEYSEFNIDLLARIKDEDLPLFMDYEWWNEDEDRYRKRMRKIGHAITK